MNGFLVVDKPAGMTSHDVVARVRRALGIRRVGHAGTLDPGATGVLVVGAGRATRLLRFLESAWKEYRAEVLFGLVTTTLDADGEIRHESDASALDAGAVDAALGAFRGEITQVPPMVSAVKVGGERLYKKARRGEEVERPSRRVVIERLEMESFVPGSRARAVLDVRCSKGTYIRTLAADLGAALGPGASLASLRRTRVGPFGLEDAVELVAVGADRLRPMEEAVAGYPRREFDAAEVTALLQGRPMKAAGVEGPWAAWGPSGLVAMMEDRGSQGRSLCVVAEQ